MTTNPATPQGPPPPSRELDDLITRHFDAGLDAGEQRRLAEMLDASPAARATFGRYLRLESGLIRLALAGLVGRSVADDQDMIPRPRAAARPSAWLRPATLVMAGGGLVAAVIAAVFLGGPSADEGQGGEVASLAERWLELQAADAGVGPEASEPDGLESAGDELPAIGGSIPKWLVAAVVDEGAGQASPDRG